MLHKWLFAGELYDPFSEFFVALDPELAHLQYIQPAAFGSGGLLGDESTGDIDDLSGEKESGLRLWESKYILENGSINNSVMLTSMSFSRSHQSAVEPRIVVSNNDRTVKFFDVAIRNGKPADDYEPRLLDIGQLHLDVPVNHCALFSHFLLRCGLFCADNGRTASISPDGRTLLCVGDSPDVYLHRRAGPFCGTNECSSYERWQRAFKRPRHCQTAHGTLS